jgi:hypothetical protein
LVQGAHAPRNQGDLIEGGRLYRLREPNGAETIVYIRLVGARVYHLIAPANPADEAKRFFGSFKPLPAPPAQPR